MEMDTYQIIVVTTVIVINKNHLFQYLISYTLRNNLSIRVTRILQPLRLGMNCHACKDNENYKLLNSNMAQQLLKEVDGVGSVFGLIPKAKSGECDSKIRLLYYLGKDGCFTLVIGQVRISKDGYLYIPMTPAFKRLYL